MRIAVLLVLNAVAVRAQLPEDSGHPSRPESFESRTALSHDDGLPFDSSNCSLVGNWPFGPSYSLTLDSARNLVFCGSGGGVYVLDVSDSTNPVKLSEAIHTTGLAYGFCLQGDRLYVAANRYAGPEAGHRFLARQRDPIQADQEPRSGSSVAAIHVQQGKPLALCQTARCHP